MGFSISDIIILLVVAVALAVYRRLDHNNRSLEKVKRFVERVQGEMDEIVAEKVTMLKDIGIEVDVHQKAAKEVLKRIQAIEADLNTRSGGLEQIGTRLGAYETALTELITMTEQAEENLKRVQNESEYIDKVGKRIKVTQARIEELERSLPGIVTGFEKQNTQRLDQVESRILAETEERVNGLESRVETAAGRVQDFSEDAARIQAETEGRSRQACVEIQELHDRLLGELEQNISESTEASRRAFSSARQEMDEILVSSQEQFERHRSEGEEQHQGIRNALKELLEGTQARLQELAEKGSALETEALAALREHIEVTGRERAEEALLTVRQYTADARGRLEEEADEKIAVLQDRIDQKVEAVRNHSEAETSAMQEQFVQLRASADEWSEKTRQTIQEMDQQVERLLERALQQEQSQKESLDRHIAETEGRLETHGKHLDERISQLDSAAQEQMGGISDRLTRVSTEIDTHITQARESLDERIQLLEASQEGQYQEIRQHHEESLTRLAETFQERQGQIQELDAAAREEFSRLQELLDQGRAGIDRKIEEYRTGADRRIDTTAQEMEQRVLSSVDSRLTDYEQSLGYRFSKIEAVNNDVDELEQNLRSTMDRVSERVRSDFLAFGEELRALREQDRQDAIQGMDDLRGSMSELEGGLNELKQRAYDNVSEKLKVFEDEFFADLRDRSATMESRIESWRDEVHERLGTLQTEFEASRAAVEEQYSDDLRARLHEVQESTNGQLTKIDTQVDSFRGGIGSRMDALEQSMTGFEETLSEELVSLKDRSNQTFRQEFSQFDDRIRGELKNFENEVEGKVGQIRHAVGAGKDELEAMVEAARSDVAVWQTKVLNELRSSDAEVSNQLADARVRLSDNIQELKREFAAEREHLVDQSLDQRRALREELDKTAEDVTRLKTQLEEQGETALAEFSRRYQELRARTEEHEKQISARLEDQSSEFRGLIADTRDQFSAMREKLLGKLEEEARTLETTLQEIDKRQRGFIEQTGIFERADSLKTQLQDDIEELKNEILRVEGMRGEVRDIEGQFGKIRKMSGEVNEKMARFAADKRRIDLLEEDYRRLISLAQSVETKIEQVSNSDDQLQEITARVRSLDELQQEVETRFDRLERRRSLIDETTDGLEESRASLDDLRGQLSTLTERVEQFPGFIAKLSGQLKQVASHHKETEKAVENLASLNETLADVERRMDELKTAREWLARTETRLEEIRRDAGEQVKLLGSLMREEGKKSTSPGGGAPSLSARETVQKLAHQGWKVDEIARATKMSKGEVELILELSGRR
ncbi:Chromosome segregation ATPase [Alkalispirochaeta americana]|uniref:Chromosome segregation ATPase n=1 Tax=Alkalispirochaeta americana TaxID=159291 RepID=A0A1N6W1P8_9SPIO|nr:hypothetical protein [Alkalispirochaeta americana]SIQ83978.1 Chromosome segregation ATPase [Alkalispirochaeta americana]